MKMEGDLAIKTYQQAINDTIHEEMCRDDSIFIIGGETKMFGSLEGLENTFSSQRVITTPISEDATTGLVLGAALSGLRPIQVHIRVDFLMLAVNQIINIFFCGLRISRFTAGSNCNQSSSWKRLGTRFSTFKISSWFIFPGARIGNNNANHPR